MSADNGIYILETQEDSGVKEYRVAECQSIDNIYFGSQEERDESVRHFFGQSPIYMDYQAAREVAFQKEQEIYDRGWVLEYGISSISLPTPFPLKNKIVSNSA